MLRMFYIPTVYILILFSTVICNEEKANEAIATARKAFLLFFYFFNECLETSMPNQRFIVDNPQNYINELSKTTVGSAPQFTSNRKFFANMIAHPIFKDMLARDLTALQNSRVKKMKFCDESAMDLELLKQLYDREVDQTKL